MQSEILFNQYINFSLEEETVFVLAKQDTVLLYVKYFLPTTIFLWKNISTSEYAAISGLVFEGQISKYKTKSISAAISKVVSREGRYPPEVIGVLQQEIVSTAAKSELAKLQSFNNKHTNMLLNEIKKLKNKI